MIEGDVVRLVLKSYEMGLEDATPGAEADAVRSVLTDTCAEMEEIHKDRIKALERVGELEAELVSANGRIAGLELCLEGRKAQVASLTAANIELDKELKIRREE